MDSPTIMSIKQMIDAAFGDPKINVVNHKLIHAVLIILARQIRLLERRVEVDLGPIHEITSTTGLNVTEVKMYANVPKKQRQRKTSSGSVGGAGGASEASGASGAAGTSSRSKSSSDKTASGTAGTSSRSKSSSDKTASGTAGTSSRSKSSSDKTASDTAGTSSRSKSSSDKTTTEKSSSDKSKTVTLSDQPSKSNLPQKYLTMLDKIETQREMELRVIHQRADSREEQKKKPTPIASMDEMEKQYEKLLIVERVPTDQDGRSLSSRGPRLSVVTQEEFAELAAAVRRLEQQYFPAGTASFPENAEFLEELRQGASLTDAMAALQLSARLEAAEKALEKMISLVTDLAKDIPPLPTTTSTSGKSEQKSQSRIGKGADSKTEVILGEDDTTSRVSTASKKIDPSKKSKAQLGKKSGVIPLPSESEKNVESAAQQQEEAGKENKDWITAEELDDVMQEVYDEFLKKIKIHTTKSNENANNALNLAHRLEKKLEESLNLGARMENLEMIVSEYANHTTTLDTEMSSQITNYQEQLTQMQHELESGIEAMQEAVTNTCGDTAAITELNNNFTSLQIEIDIATMQQKELKQDQNKLSIDLQALWKQIEILKDEKSDRDEVADALRDKAGIAALNGLVSRPEFDAVRGDFEKRIGAAYDKFNNQEVVWQKAIDELLRELGGKADWIQVVSLQESIAKYLEKFNNRIYEMAEIVGEPRAAAVSRKLHRDAACLSCKTPAYMDVEEPNVGPSFPEFPSTRPEQRPKPSEDGDHRGVCYPGYPIPHPIDPRSHVCRRYCGGSHTMLNNTTSRVPPGMIVNTLPASPKIETMIGTDGKAHMVDHVLKPCKACYIPAEEPQMPKKADPVPEIPLDTKSSGMTPPDYRISVLSGCVKQMGSTGDGEMSSTLPPIRSD